MTNSCDDNCSSCSENCEDRKAPLIELLNEHSKVKKVIGVVSGKGGVGKSLVTSMSAVHMNRLGYRVGILDADITGPSIPKSFGLAPAIRRGELGHYPAETKTGINVMSTNLLLENETDPVVWKGPIISSAVKQFWTDFIWEDIDYMFIDMPPGTGDVSLTVFQSLPVDGIIIVTSPQELVSMIVAKAVNMANMMDIPILGLVENMSYYQCKDCGEKQHIFGKSKIKDVAKEYNLDILAQIPIDSEIAKACDDGNIEDYHSEHLGRLGDKLVTI